MTRMLICCDGPTPSLTEAQKDILCAKIAEMGVVVDDIHFPGEGAVDRSDAQCIIVRDLDRLTRDGYDGDKQGGDR